MSILSGDVAIYDYNEGKVRDMEHDLRAIRQTICTGEAERIWSILSEDCVYVSNVGNWYKEGREEVIGVFETVSKAHEWMYAAHMATIGESETAEELKYKTGTRCLVLENENKDYESIMFAEHDETGNIDLIEVTNDSRYRFHVDKSFVKSGDLDFEQEVYS